MFPEILGRPWVAECHTASLPIPVPPGAVYMEKKSPWHSWSALAYQWLRDFTDFNWMKSINNYNFLHLELKRVTWKGFCFCFEIILAFFLASLRTSQWKSWSFYRVFRSWYLTALGLLLWGGISWPSHRMRISSRNWTAKGSTYPLTSFLQSTTEIK